MMPLDEKKVNEKRKREKKILKINKREKGKKKKENKKWKKMMAPALALVKQRESTEDGTYQLEHRYGTHGKGEKREKDKMSSFEKSGKVYRNSLYYSCNFSIYLILCFLKLQRKKH